MAARTSGGRLVEVWVISSIKLSFKNVISSRVACYSWHTKLPASFGSPCPVYSACCGYGHNGRLRPGNARPVATTRSGATPFSTQSTTALNMSNWSSVALPP